MRDLTRRSLLRGAAATAGLAYVGGPFSGFLARAGAAPSAPAAGPLLGPVPDLRDEVVRLWLPVGFQYRSFHDTDSADPVVLDDGTVLPGRHDGMAAFPGRHGNVTLIRNHEVNGPGTAFGNTARAYDPAAQGGTTTIEVTPFGEVLRARTSLNGTQMNCAGGAMPWGSWVTCEETVNGPDVGPDFTGAPNTALQEKHGYIFEVPVRGQSNRKPITRAGRFAHEAVAYSASDNALYMTEDNFGFPSGFYRYLPKSDAARRGRLDDKGRLQMLAVAGLPGADLAATQPADATYAVTWVDIDDPDPTFPYTPGETAPTANDVAISYVGAQGRSQGAARFSRLEGAVHDGGVVYFCSTQGGGPAEPTDQDSVHGWGNGSGQIWAYDVASERLRLVYQSPGPAVLDLPDNVTTHPVTGTLVLCEDNADDNYVRGLTPDGELFDIALNRMSTSAGAPRWNDEFAGATFSPDGHTLFVNVQASRGITFAIWGPWGSIGV